MARESAVPRTQSFGVALDLERIIAANQRGLHAAADAQKHLLQRMSQVGNELFRFVGRRLEHDRDTTRRLAECHTPQEVAGVYGAFFECAMKEYSEEFGLLAGICADHARQAMQDVQYQIEDVTETPEPEDRAGAR